MSLVILLLPNALTCNETSTHFYYSRKVITCRNVFSLYAKLMFCILQVVMPVNGVIKLRSNTEGVLIHSTDSDFNHYDILISNIRVASGINKDGIFVGAGSVIGYGLGKSDCTYDYIHLAMIKKSDSEYIDPSSYVDNVQLLPQWHPECKEFIFRHIGQIIEAAVVGGGFEFLIKEFTTSALEWAGLESVAPVVQGILTSPITGIGSAAGLFAGYLPSATDVTGVGFGFDVEFVAEGGGNPTDLLMNEDLGPLVTDLEEHVEHLLGFNEIRGLLEHGGDFLATIGSGDMNTVQINGSHQLKLLCNVSRGDVISNANKLLDLLGHSAQAQQLDSGENKLKYLCNNTDLNLKTILSSDGILKQLTGMNLTSLIPSLKGVPPFLIDLLLNGIGSGGPLWGFLLQLLSGSVSSGRSGRSASHVSGHIQNSTQPTDHMSRCVCVVIV
jgi:hypothetical protein